MTSARFPYHGIVRDRGLIHLYHRSPRALRTADLDIVSALHRVWLLSWWSFTFCCFTPFCGSISASSNSWIGLFFFTSGLARGPWSTGGRGGGRGRLIGVWTLGASSEVTPLPLLAIKPLKLGLFLGSIASASLELVSKKAMVCPGWWAIKSLSDSVSESEISTNLSGVLSSANWNLLFKWQVWRWGYSFRYGYSCKRNLLKGYYKLRRIQLSRQYHKRQILSCKEPWLKNVYPSKTRVACSQRLARVLVCAWQRLVTQDKVSGPQLPIFVHKYLRP